MYDRSPITIATDVGTSLLNPLSMIVGFTKERQIVKACQFRSM